MPKLALAIRDHLARANDMLSVFQEAVSDGGHAEGSEPARIADLAVAEFQHGSDKVRGLTTKTGIPKGEIVLVVPKPMRSVPDHTLDERFSKPQEPEPSHLGIWLAERRAELLSKPRQSRAVPDNQDHDRIAKHVHESVEPPSPEERYWETYIRSIPTIEALKGQGIPLLQPEEDLNKLLHLPHVSIIPKFVKATKQELWRLLKDYNEKRGDRPPLSWTDALWGRAVVDSRGFSCQGTTLVPVADLINAGKGGKANIDGHCDEGFRDLTIFVAKSDIEPGEELTMAYVPEDPASTPSGVGPWLVKKYGFADGAPSEPWTAAECRSFQNANFSKSSNPLLRTIDELAQKNCSAPMSRESEAAMREFRRNYAKAIAARKEQLQHAIMTETKKEQGLVKQQMLSPLLALPRLPRPQQQLSDVQQHRQSVNDFL